MRIAAHYNIFRTTRMRNSNRLNKHMLFIAWSKQYVWIDPCSPTHVYSFHSVPPCMLDGSLSMKRCCRLVMNVG